MSNIYLKAVGLGFIAGMRSMAAPALVSRHFANAPSTSLAKSSLGFLGHPTTANILGLMASGELVGDKLPNTPNRTSPGALSGRAVCGGLCGAAVFAAEDEPLLLGAAIGAATAVASTFATFYLRRWVVGKTKLPDPAIALAEDTLTLGLASRVFVE